MILVVNIDGLTATTALAHSSGASHSTTLAPPERQQEPQLDGLLAEALNELKREDGVRLSVAVKDSDSGRQAVSDGATYDTASIVKVDVLAALLLQTQDANQTLTTQQRALAQAMIQSSDNAATTALWDEIGGAEGLTEANERLGLTATTAGEGGLWGLTQTTAADQLTLLEQVFGTPSALDQHSQEYLTSLMGNVAEGQAWGVSAAGDDASLKNGWLPRSGTGLWDVNSVGRVQVDGHAYLVVVLSDGNRSKEQGIRLVEQAARTAIPTLATTS